MGFFVLGLNHHQCPVAVRERIHFTPSEAREALEKMRGRTEVSELLVLSTCNRVDFYGYADGPDLPEALLLHVIQKAHGVPRSLFASYLYRHRDHEAIRHLFRVAAGLDSLVVGENEILGQLREAFQIACEVRSVHSVLYRLMEKALKVGKDVRTGTKINEGAVSIPSVAVELAEKIFGRLQGEKVMVLGAGEMSLLTLRSLKEAGAQVLYLVSRDRIRGEELALPFDAQWVSFDDWEPRLLDADILIASTSSPHPVVRCDQVKRVMERRRHRPLFVIDIAVPRDVDGSVNQIDDVYLYNIDDLKGVAAANMRLRRREVRAAEVLVEGAVQDYQGWLARLRARPTLERFESFLDEILEREFARFARKTGIPEAEARDLRQRVRAKLLHPPREKIKEASLNGGVNRYLEALESLFDLDREK